MAKKEYTPTAVEFLEVEGKLFAQTTKKNDLITITSDLDKPVFVKASKGTDSISFEGINTVADLQDRSKITFKHVAGTKNLEIDLLNNDGSVKQTVTIENYFKKVDGKATASSIKNVQLTDGGVTQYVAILDQALIDYDQVIVATKKKATGTAFNDVISGSTQNDTIKGNGGNDVIDAGTGNDKIYGGKGADTFVFGTYQLSGKFYGSGMDTVYDAEDIDTFEFSTSNVEELKFEQYKTRDLRITYIDKNDETGATTENVVTVKNYYDKSGARVKNFQISALDEYGNLGTWESVETVRTVEFKEDMATKRAIQEAAAAAAEAERARKAAEYDQVAQDLADTQEELATTQGVLEQTEADLETATENYNTAKTNYETTKAAFEAYEEEHLKTNEEYQAMSDAKDEAQANFEEAQANYNTKKAELDAYTASHTYNNTEYALLEQQKDTAAANYETAQANYEAKAQALAAYEATHQHDNVAYNNLVQAKEQAEADFTAYAANHSKTDAEYQAKEAALADATQALADYEESHSHDDTEWSNLVTEKNTAETNYQTAKQNYETTKAAYDTYKTNYEHSNTEYALLEQQKDTATANYNTAKANYEQAQADLTAYTATHQYDNVEYNNLVQQKALADQALTDYKSNHNNTDAAYTALEQAKEAADAALTAYEESHSHDDTEWGELLAAKNTAQSNYETAQANYEQATSDLEAYQASHEHDNEAYNAKVAELTQAQADLATAQSEKTAAENALEVYTANHSRTNEEYQAMSDAKDAAELARDAAITDKETAETALTNYQNTHTHDNTEWTALTTEKNTAVANYEAAQANLLAKVSELATYEANHLKTNAEYQALEQAKAAADQALTDYEATHSKTDAQYQDMVDAKNAADQALADYMEDYAHSNTEYQEKVDAVTAAETARDAAIADKATAEAALTAYQETHSKTDAEYDAKVAELTQAQADLATAQAGKTAAETALTNYQNTHSYTDTQYATLAEQKAAALADYATAQATVTTLTGEKAALENQVGTLTTEKAALQAQLDAIAAGKKDYSAFENTSLSATKNSEYDKLVFANSRFTGCEFTQDGDDLVITYHDDKNHTGASGTLRLEDYFATTTNNRIDTFIDKDGNEHSITDALNGGSTPAYDETVVGTTGADTFTPTADKELFVVNGGADIFNDSDSADKVTGDKVQLTTGTIQADVSYSKTVGSDDLVVNYDDGSVTLKGYFTEGKYSPETLIVDDAEFNIASDLETKGITVYTTENPDTFPLTPLKETFVVNNGDVFEVPLQAEQVAGDKIKITGSKSDVTYSKNKTNSEDLDVTYGSSHDKTITIKGVYSMGSAGYYPDTLVDDYKNEFNIDTDISEKGFTLFGNKSGVDTFVPTEDKETFVVSNGDKIDVSDITNEDVVKNDKIQITGSRSDVYYTHVLQGDGSGDLVIHYDTDKTATLTGLFPSDSSSSTLYYPETIKASDGEFSLTEDIADKGILFAGTSGADTFSPTLLKDRFVISGNDTLYAGSPAYPSYETTDDVIQFDCSKSSLSYEQDGANLIINYGDAGNKLTLQNFFDVSGDGELTALGSKTLTVVTTSGSFRLMDDLNAKGITHNGTAGDNAFAPTEFRDVIVLNGGNDTYAGSAGSYEYSKLAEDTIQIDCGRDEISYQPGEDGSLIVVYPTGSLEITHFDADQGAASITIVTNDGPFNIMDDFNAKGVTQQGTAGDNEFKPTAFRDVIILAGGDDKFTGSDGASYAESNMVNDAVKINCNKEQITYTRDEDDLIITYPSGTLTIENYYNDGGASDVTIVSNNGTFKIGADLEIRGYTVYSNPSESTTFVSTEDKETFVVKSGDTITYPSSDAYTKVKDDKIQITGNKAGVSYSREANASDLIINYDSYKHIKMDSYFSSGYYYPETIKASDEEFNFVADVATKGVTVTGTNNPDNFTITTAKETFVVGNGDKIGYSSSVGYTDGDKIEITGTRNEVSYSVSEDDSNDLVITYDSGKTITIDEYFDESKYNPEKLKIGSSEFYIYTDMMKKGLTFEASYGSDSTFTPTEFKDTFVFNGGADKINCAKYDGVDYEPYDFSGDKIEISGYSDIKYSISGDPTANGDLILTYGSGSYSVTLKNYFANPDAGSLKLVASGTETSIGADIVNKGYVIDGGVMYKKVDGTTGDDSFEMTTDTELFVAKGGNDTYDFASSGGYQFAIGDKVELMGNRADLSYARSSDDLVISYNGGTFTMKGYFTSDFNIEHGGNVKLKTADYDNFTVAVDMEAKGGPSASLASNNRIATLSFEASAWQSAGADSGMTDVAMNNPDEVNLMQIYTNNA